MLKHAWALLRQGVADFGEDQASTYAAAIAFYAVSAMAPLLLIAISIAGLVLGQQAAQGQILGQISGIVGEGAGRTLQTMLASARSHGSGIVALVLGSAALVYTATGFFAQLQLAMNRVWEVRQKRSLGVWGTIRTRLLGLIMVLLLGVLFLAFLLVSAGLHAFAAALGRLFTGGAVITQIGEVVISLGLFTVLYALLFKFLPDAKIRWRDVWFGAFVTAVLFTAGHYAIGLYLGRANLQSSYGAAGSLVLLLFWVYYSALILLLGAEITQVQANKYGAGVEPSREAERVIEPGRERPSGGEAQAA